MCVLFCVSLKWAKGSSEVGEKGQISDQSALDLQWQCFLKSILQTYQKARFRHSKLCSKSGRNAFVRGVFSPVVVLLNTVTFEELFEGRGVKKEMGLTAKGLTFLVCTY